jgi:hypothetical protein
MNRKNLMLILAFAVMMWGASSVFAHGSSHPKSDTTPGGTFVPYDLATRVMHFSNDSIWQNQAGEIMVCPLGVTAEDRGSGKLCFDEKDKLKKDRWMFLNELKMPGFEISGVDFRLAGQYGSQHLYVYWRKIPAPEPTPVPVAAQASAQPAPATIVINASRVVVVPKK